MSLKLEERPFEYEGKTYILRCNMAVLEAVQEDQDGDFASLLELPITKSAVIFLAAMLNDYAEEQGWPERFTPAALRRRVSLAMVKDADVLGIITRGLIPLVQPAGGQGAPTEAAETEPGTLGN